MDLLRRILLFFSFFLVGFKLEPENNNFFNLFIVPFVVVIFIFKDICEHGPGSCSAMSFELWRSRYGVVGRRRPTMTDRPAILLLNNIIFVRRNENKHRFIIMTQNFLFHFHLALSRWLLGPFSDHTDDCFPGFFSPLLLLLRSPEQYSEHLSPQPFIFISIWLMILERILFLMAFRSIIIQSLAYSAFLGFFWAF